MDEESAAFIPFAPGLPRHPFHGALKRKPSGIPVATVTERPWCRGQFRLSIFKRRVGTPPLRLNVAQGMQAAHSQSAGGRARGNKRTEVAGMRPKVMSDCKT